MLKVAGVLTVAPMQWAVGQGGRYFDSRRGRSFKVADVLVITPSRRALVQGSRYSGTYPDALPIGLR